MPYNITYKAKALPTTTQSMFPHPPQRPLLEDDVS